MNSLRLCGGSAATTDMLVMKRTFMSMSLDRALDGAAEGPGHSGKHSGARHATLGHGLAPSDADHRRVLAVLRYLES